MRIATRFTAPCLAVIAMALSGCSSAEPAPSSSAPAVAHPVALSTPDVPRGLTVGVVVSVKSGPGEGAEWAESAEGARVAAWRYEQAGVSVTLRAKDDRGSSEGAAKAVKELAAEHVSAIVFATSGPHLNNAVDAAVRARIPVLLPYETRREEAPAGAWHTGPTADAVSKATGKTLTRLHSTGSLGIYFTGASLPAAVADRLEVRPGTSVVDLTSALQSKLKERAADVFVVGGDAREQATIAAAVQGAGSGLPVVFGPDAVSPALPDALAQAGASSGGNYWTVGSRAVDSSALAPGAEGRALAAFLAADRLAAADDKVTNLIGDLPFRSVAGSADAASHDAVVAVVEAASSARNLTPSEVGKALGRLRLTQADGLAGPALDFTRSRALDERSVVTLRSSAGDPGLRPSDPAGAAPTVNWFVAQK